jgi:hypothetical protein
MNLVQISRLLRLSLLTLAIRMGPLCEGFICGLPQALGAIDLTETDAIEMEGVIRDVSRLMVDNEIRNIVAMRRQAAE